MTSSAPGDRGSLAGVRLGLLAEASPEISDLEEALLREGAFIERMHPSTTQWYEDLALDLVIIRIERRPTRRHSDGRSRRHDAEVMQGLVHSERVMALVDEPPPEDAGPLCDFALPPFRPAEVIPRILRVLRAPHPSASIRVGNAELNPANRTLLIAGHAVDLTYAEFEIFWALLAANGGVLSRDALHRRLGDAGAELKSRRIDIHIHRLRAKLHDMSGASIDTVRNVGYRLSVVRPD